MPQVQLDNTTKLTQEVCAEQVMNLIAASKKWWLTHRPEVYSEADHLANPTVNVVEPASDELAKTVANIVRLGL